MNVLRWNTGTLFCALMNFDATLDYKRIFMSRL